MYPGSPSRCACQPEEVLRMPGAFSGSWTRRSGWRAPRTAWCSSASVPPLRRKELELKVREGAGWRRGLLSSSSPLPVGGGLCLLEALTRPALGGLCTRLGVRLHSFMCSSIHVFIMCSEWALIYTEANSLIGPLSLLGRGRGGR